MKPNTWKWGAGALLLAGALGGGVWWATQGGKNEVQYRTAKIERGPLSATVSASGAVNPVTQVSVGTQVSGQIKELYVDFNSEVKAGQLIAVIDPESIEYRVRQAQADTDAARATVLTAQANAAAGRAGVSRAESDLVEAQRSHARNQSLQAQGFISQAEVDRTRALVATAGESVKSAQAQIGVTDAQIKSAQAGVAQREASLAQARIDLSRTKITSPVDGIVIKRAVEKGQTVAASLQSPELFVIAQNLQDMQVDASIDESDVGRVRAGQKASFTVDAFPGQTFEGSVKQVRKAAQNVANVVTYVAVVAFSNTGGRLLPGMTANVRLVTDQRESVLKVPNAALRVRIAGVEPPAAGPAGAASGPGRAASGTTTGRSGWSWVSEAVAQPAGGGGGLSAMRERLTTELNLNPDQQAKLDAIGAELRPRFMALRDLPEDQRPAEREKITADMRTRISAMLTPEQKALYAQMQQNRPPPQGAPVASSQPPNATKSIAASADSTRSKASKPTESPTPAPGAVTGSALPPPAPAAAGPSGPGGGGATEFRNRLVSELALTPAQVEKVDAIYADSRPKFMQLRDLPQEERARARDRITADIRGRIGDLLTPEQKPKYAALVAEAASRTSTQGRIYLMGDDGKPQALNVRLGITDGSSTELLVPANSPNADKLKEGALVIVGTVAGTGSSATKPAATGPRMPF
jgi:HlyD family secretion protein